MQIKKFNLIILGDGAVGKTSLLSMFHTGKMNMQHVKTIGVDHVPAKFSADGHTFNVKIWDTAGQEKFRTITTNFYRQAQGILIAFDITNQESFNGVKNWVESIYKNCDLTIPKILIGNKVDMEDKRQVSQSQANKLAAEHMMLYFETSALQNLKVADVMQHIMQEVYEKKFKEKLGTPRSMKVPQQEQQEQSSSGVVKLDGRHSLVQPEKTESGGCCS